MTGSSGHFYFRWLLGRNPSPSLACHCDRLLRRARTPAHQDYQRVKLPGYFGKNILLGLLFSAPNKLANANPGRQWIHFAVSCGRWVIRPWGVFKINYVGVRESDASNHPASAAERESEQTSRLRPHAPVPFLPRAQIVCLRTQTYAYVAVLALRVTDARLHGTFSRAQHWNEMRLTELH